MNILALDTAGDVFSAALATENGFWYNEVNAGSSHSELLMECIDCLFKLSKSPPEELNMIACMKGPGSFTGLRIGFSTAKGLAMALGIPYVSIPTLDCMAYAFSAWPGIILPVIDAKKGCFFSAFYRGYSRLSEYSDLPPDLIVDMIDKIRLSENEPLVLTGPGAALFLSRLPSDHVLKKTLLTPNNNRGRAWELLELSKSVNIKERLETEAGPVYLRKSDAELNKSQ